MFAGGLDIGTSGCKIVLYNEKGEHSKSAYKEYNVKRTSGLHEIDSKEIFESVKSVIKEVACKELASIAVTSFGETFVMLDEKDEPCAPSMLYTDSRGSAECKTLAEKFGADNLSYKTGAKPHEMFSLPKIMWIKNNMPENFERAKYILLMQDYIVYMLCGKRQIDYSLATRTLAFDIKNKHWDSEILNFCGIDEKLFSKPVPSGSAADKIKAGIAEELGLSADTIIVNGCHDQVAAMIGASVFEPEDVMDGTGTVECIPVIMNDVPKDFSLYEHGYSITHHINGKFVCYVLSYAGGASLKWFRDNFSDISYAEMDKLVIEKPSDLLIMPYFAGAATPYMDSTAKAAIIGLTFEHGKYDIYKALMEGTAFEIKLNLEVLEKFGVKPVTLIATGGGANSDVWLQIKADVLGVPVKALKGDEIGSAGTALLAGRAVGMYSESEKLTEERKTFYPNKEKTAFYKTQFEKYKKIYNATKEINEN